MGKKVLIIGAGGVGGVVVHKCAPTTWEVFSEIILASRTEARAQGAGCATQASDQNSPGRCRQCT